VKGICWGRWKLGLFALKILLLNFIILIIISFFRHYDPATNVLGIVSSPIFGLDENDLHVEVK